MIIVEGPDGSGKSTLIENLAREFGLPVQPSPGPPKSLAEIHHSMSVLLTSQVPGLWDRCRPLSEWIYGRILRDHSLLDPYNWHYINVLARGPFLWIYCRPPMADIRAALDKTDQLHGVKQNIILIVERYDLAMLRIQALTRGNFIRYVWNKETSVEQTKRRVAEYVAKLAHQRTIFDQWEKQ